MSTPKTQVRAKRAIKARLVKANNAFSDGRHDPSFDHWEIPATPEAYEAMMEQFWNDCLRQYDKGSSMNYSVRYAFARIGMVPSPRPLKQTGKK